MLQEKISIEELKKQRLIMNIEDQRFLIKKNREKTGIYGTENKIKMKENESSIVN